jgi:hypothetical protein
MVSSLLGAGFQMLTFYLSNLDKFIIF